MLLITLIVLAPGWRCTLTITAGVWFIPRGLVVIFDPSTMRRRPSASPVRHCGTPPPAPVILAADQLIVGVDLIILARSVEISLGGVHAGLRQRRPQVFHVHAIRCQRRRIRLNPHRRLLTAADAHQAHPLSWAIFGTSRVSTMSSTCESGIDLDVTASVSTGASAGLVLRKSAGRAAPTADSSARR